MASVKAVLESGKDNPYEQYKVRRCSALRLIDSLQDNHGCTTNLWQILMVAYIALMYVRLLCYSACTTKRSEL
jgi:hypothetical protein